MAKLLDPDNPIMQLLSRVTDLLILSILWTACSLPLITVGPATAALYYVTLKMVQDSESGVLRSFFRSFRQNFRQGTLLTILLAAAALFLYWDIKIFAGQSSNYAVVLRTLFLILGAALLLSAGYVFPLLGQFENTVFRTLRNAFFLSLGHPLRSIAILVLNLIPLGVFLFYPEVFYRTLPCWLIAAPGIIAYFCSLLLFKPFTGKKIPSSKPEE